MVTCRIYYLQHGLLYDYTIDLASSYSYFGNCLTSERSTDRFSHHLRGQWLDVVRVRVEEHLDQEKGRVARKKETGNQRLISVGLTRSNVAYESTNFMQKKG